MHPLNGALAGPYVPVRVTRGALVAHRYTYAPPRCRTLQYRRTFIPFSVSLWNDLANAVFDVRAGPMLLYWPKLHYPYTIVFYSFSLSLLSVYIGWYCGAGVFGLIRYTSISLSLALPTFFNNNNNNNDYYLSNITAIIFVMYYVHIKWLVVNFFWRFFIATHRIISPDYKSCVRFKKILSELD